MGFLRKVGRKIKKGVKKLFGGKFGKILGGIGLSMMFWGGAKALFGGQGGWFDSLSSKLKDMKPFGDTSVTSTIEKLDTVTNPVPTTPLTDTPFKDLKGFDKLKKVGVETKEFLFPEESMDTFVPDVAKSVLGTVAVGKIMEEEEQTAGFGRMPSVGSMEAPQSAYVAEVRNQMPNLQATNFNQLNQSLFYGTLSPQYLMGQVG